MDLDEEIKSREEGEIGSESREKGDLLPCSSPLWTTRWSAGTPRRRKTRKICKRFDALATTDAMCSFHFKSFWIISPRNLHELNTSNGWSSVIKGANWSFLLKKNNRNSLHFLALRCNHLLEAQLIIWSSSDYENDKLPLLRFSDNEISSSSIPKLRAKALPNSLTIERNKIEPNLQTKQNRSFSLGLCSRKSKLSITSFRI